MPKNRKERIDNNVKTIYVWYIIGGNRATHGHGSKFPAKEKWYSH